MTIKSLDLVMERLTGPFEGGYVDDKRDPGGRTKYGITERVARKHGFDVRNLTKGQALEIYRKDYWDVCRCDDMPLPVAMVVFDAAVNQGPRRAGRFLQKALNRLNARVAVDGVIGPNTISKTVWITSGRNGVENTGKLVTWFVTYRDLHWTSLTKMVWAWTGWLRRGNCSVWEAARLIYERQTISDIEVYRSFDEARAQLNETMILLENKLDRIRTGDREAVLDQLAAQAQELDMGYGDV